MKYPTYQCRCPCQDTHCCKPAYRPSCCYTWPHWGQLPPRWPRAGPHLWWPHSASAPDHTLTLYREWCTSLKFRVVLKHFNFVWSVSAVTCHCLLCCNARLDLTSTFPRKSIWMTITVGEIRLMSLWSLQFLVFSSGSINLAWVWFYWRRPQTFRSRTEDNHPYQRAENTLALKYFNPDMIQFSPLFNP